MLLPPAASLRGHAAGPCRAGRSARIPAAPVRLAYAGPYPAPAGERHGGECMERSDGRRRTRGACRAGAALESAAGRCAPCREPLSCGPPLMGPYTARTAAQSVTTLPRSRKKGPGTSSPVIQSAYSSSYVRLAPGFTACRPSRCILFQVVLSMDNIMFWLQTANVIVLALTFGAVVWYALETQRLRKTAEDQLEALHYPCVVPDYDFISGVTAQTFYAQNQAGWTALRVKQHVPSGQIALRNIGTGPALCVKCLFEPTGSIKQAPCRASAAFVPARAVVQIPVSYQHIQAYDFTFTATYYSVSGRKYETRGTLVNGVLCSDFQVRPLPRST
jgi:hypothetical protein